MPLKQIPLFIPDQLNRMVEIQVFKRSILTLPPDYCRDAAAWKKLVDFIAGPDAELFMRVTLHYEKRRGGVGLPGPEGMVGR